MATRRIPADSGSMSELSRDECYRRLARLDVGRVGICTEDGPTIIPVNYVMDGESVVIRTAPYTRLAEHAVGAMALEVDQFEPALKFGWSVLVVGHAMPVEDVDEATQLRSSGMLQAWVPGPRNLFIRITPRQITGREIS